MQKELKLQIKQILDCGGDSDAYDNLLGALIDLERGVNDYVCHRTIRRVMHQLWDVQLLVRDAVHGQSKETD